VKELGPILGILGILLGLTVSTPAETLSGTVLDPQQRVIVEATVEVTCGHETTVDKTDGRGRFTLRREIVTEDCTLRAAHPGFEKLERVVGRARVFVLQLRLAEVKQTIRVQGDTLSRTSLLSVSLSEAELKAVSDNTKDLIEYAKHLAGVSSGSDRIYFDGLPTNSLPPAGSIERITVNADPFAPEYSDGSDAHIDIFTKSRERKFHFDFGGASLGGGGGSILNSHLKSSSRTAKAALSGPIPHLPITFTSDATVASQSRGEPIEAVMPLFTDHQHANGTSVPATSLNRSLLIGAYYSTDKNLRANISIFSSDGRQSNVNVSGVTLPEAGMSQRATTREIRTTLSKTGDNYLYRGGLVTSSSRITLNANSIEVGLRVLGNFVAGGAAVSHEAVRSSNWTVKNVVELNSRGHYWAVGTTLSRVGDWQVSITNPFGVVEFSSWEQYIKAFKGQAHTGTWLITRGSSPVDHQSYTAAPFVQGELHRWSSAAVTGGLRMDYQTGGKVLLSPRVSAVASVGKLVLRAGIGMFARDWSNRVLLTAIQNDGVHLRQLMSTSIDLADLQRGGANTEVPVLSRIDPSLVPAHEWMSKVSVERAFWHWLAGIEYSRTTGTHFLGSRRMRGRGEWIDMLESNRSRQQHQLHVSMRYESRGQSLTTHYEWTHARDNTDGPFSFPAIQENIRGEWGPASGISRHNVTVVANLQFGKATSLSLVDVARSAVPLNLVSGVDVENNGLYTDRAGRPRNSAHGAAYNCMELFAHRRFALPRLFPISRQKLHADIGLNVENLFGNRNYVSLGNVIGSPLLGRPLTALGGRSLRLSLDFAR